MNLFETYFWQKKRKSATKLEEGGGVKTLVAGQLKKELSFAASHRLFWFQGLNHLLITFRKAGSSSWIYYFKQNNIETAESKDVK